MYAVGALFYRMLGLPCPPFHNNFAVPVIPKMSPVTNNFFARLVASDPSLRLSAKEAVLNLQAMLFAPSFNSPLDDESVESFLLHRRLDLVFTASDDSKPLTFGCSSEQCPWPLRKIPSQATERKQMIKCYEVVQSSDFSQRARQLQLDGAAN